MQLPILIDPIPSASRRALLFFSNLSVAVHISLRSMPDLCEASLIFAAMALTERKLTPLLHSSFLSRHGFSFWSSVCYCMTPDRIPKTIWHPTAPTFFFLFVPYQSCCFTSCEELPSRSPMETSLATARPPGSSSEVLCAIEQRSSHYTGCPHPASPRAHTSLTLPTRRPPLLRQSPPSPPFPPGQQLGLDVDCLD